MKLSLRKGSRAGVAVAGLAMLAACTHRGDVRIGPEALRTEGGATYSTRLLEGEKGPSDRKGNPAQPKVTSDFKGAPPTNEWWSSIIWNFDGDPYSRTMFPHPLAMRGDAEGLGVSYPKEPSVEARGFKFP